MGRARLRFSTMMMICERFRQDVLGQWRYFMDALDEQGDMIDCNELMALPH